MTVQRRKLRGTGCRTQVRHHRLWDVLFSCIGGALECLLCCIDHSVCGFFGGVGFHTSWEVSWNRACQIGCLVCWWTAVLSSGSVGVGFYFILNVGDGSSSVFCPVVGWWMSGRGWNGCHWREVICETPSYTYHSNDDDDDDVVD